jgi:hypothetical protein
MVAPCRPCRPLEKAKAERYGSCRREARYLGSCPASGPAPVLFWRLQGECPPAFKNKGSACRSENMRTPQAPALRSVNAAPQSILAATILAFKFYRLARFVQAVRRLRPQVHHLHVIPYLLAIQLLPHQLLSQLLVVERAGAAMQNNRLAPCSTASFRSSRILLRCKASFARSTGHSTSVGIIKDSVVKKIDRMSRPA